VPVDNISPNIHLDPENVELLVKSKLIKILEIKNMSVLCVSLRTINVP